MRERKATTVDPNRRLFALTTGPPTWHDRLRLCSRGRVRVRPPALLPLRRSGARRIRRRTIRRGLFVAGQLVAWRMRRRTIRRNCVSQSHCVCNYWLNPELQ